MKNNFSNFAHEKFQIDIYLSRCAKLFFKSCIAYCALSASDNSRVGVATLLYVTN